MKKIFEKIKNWKWAKKNPKLFYTYSMSMLIILFVINIGMEVFMKKEKSDFMIVPSLYKKSDITIGKMKIKEENMGKIVEELKILKIKREKGILTSNDSLRIEFLYNKYQKEKE